MNNIINRVVNKFNCFNVMLISVLNNYLKRDWIMY